MTLPTRLAYLIMLIPNQATKGVALAIYVNNLKWRLILMLSAAEAKASKNANRLSILIVAFLRKKTSLEIILFVVAAAQIVDELKFRCLLNCMLGKLARILHFSDHDGIALKMSLLMVVSSLLAHISVIGYCFHSI